MFILLHSARICRRRRIGGGAQFSANPFGAAEVLNGLEMDSYAPFPYLPPVKPGKFGKVYDALCRSARQ